MNLSGHRNDAIAALLTQVSVSNTSLALSRASKMPTVYAGETDPIFMAWDRTTGITITEGQITGGITFPVTLAGAETLTNKTITSPLGLVKDDVGLSNVDNTSDLNKPVSTATLLALALKEDLANKSLNVVTDAASDTKYPSVKAVKTYVDSKVLGIVVHNDTSGKQGGSANEYYHLTNAQHTIATQSANASRAGYLTATDWTNFNAGLGGSSINITPTPVNNQVAIWSAADTIKGLSGLTYDGTDLVITGNIRATGEISAFDSGAPLNFWDDMPIATVATLGGIIVGANLTVDVNGVLNAAGGAGAALWGSMGGDIADQTDLQTALGLKLNSATYTAADVLTKIKTVDGTGTGLDADLLDGLHASAFGLVNANTTGSSGSVVTANFSIVQQSGKLMIKYGSTVIVTITSAGLISALGEVSAITAGPLT